MTYSRKISSLGNRGPGDVSSSLSFAPSISLLGKAPLVSLSLNPVSLFCFQEVLTVPNLWYSWGFCIPLCTFPSALSRCSSQNALSVRTQGWAQEGHLHGFYLGQQKPSGSCQNSCNQDLSTRLQNTTVFTPPRDVSPVEPQLPWWRAVPLLCVALPACLHNKSHNLSNWAFAWLFIKMAHGCWKSLVFGIWRWWLLILLLLDCIALQPWQVHFILFEP